MNARIAVAVFLSLVHAASGARCPAVAQERYQKPSQTILDVLNAPPFPVPYLSPPRNALLLLRGDPYPPKEEPHEMLRLQHRARALWWGESGSDAIVNEFERERRWERAYWVRPGEPGAASVLIWDLSVNEKYRDPGSPSFKITATGHLVFEQDGDWIWLAGAGSTPQGDRPFLDRFNLRTRETERLFRCDTASFETYSGILDRKRGVFLTRRETPREPPTSTYARWAAACEAAGLARPSAPRRSALSPASPIRRPNCGGSRSGS